MIEGHEGGRAFRRVHSNSLMRLRFMTWRRRIKRGEKVGLELSPEERKLLLTGLVFLHRRVEMAIRSAPPGGKAMLTLSDLDFLAGHVAGEANHARNKRTEDILGEIFDKIEGLLDLYVEEKSPVDSFRGEDDHATGPR